ncbi:hypothetical protein V2J09_001518 [Rumex salicifolius]
MASLRRVQIFACVLFYSLIMCCAPSVAMVSSPDLNTPYPKAISDLREAIVKGLGFQKDGFKVSGFDVRDALVGQSVAYEFDIEIDNKVLPFKLLEDVNRWEYVDLPIFGVEEQIKSDENPLIESRKLDALTPVLAPFQLAGPMEIWIQDAKDMRLALPHDVDAGVLKKVILADGAVVTVTGARSVSLRHPIDLPLPLNTSNDGFASGLLALAEHLQQASRVEGAPLLSLRIVGPTSLTSPSSLSPSSSSTKLKLKRLAPGLVELSSPSKQQHPSSSSALDLHHEVPTLLTPSQFTTLWPIGSLNGSNSNLLGFEKLLSSVLGPRASQKGSFKVLKADVSSQTFLKIGFGVEKKLEKEDAGVRFEGFPEWRTKPESLKMHFEVLAKVDGDKVVPERIMQVSPMEAEDTVAHSVLSGNLSMSTVPVMHAPPIPLTL